jgi:membrane protein required for colicin V production
MSMDHLSPVDAAAIAVLFLSGAMAFARGLTREVLSLAAWAGAALAALWLFPIASPWLRRFIDVQYLADGATILGLFTLALLVFSILTGSLASRVQKSGLSAIDRSLGFAFGAVRGAALLSLLYIFAGWLWPQPPEWLQASKSRPYLDAGANVLRDLLPRNALGGADHEAQRAYRRQQETIEANRALERLANPQPGNASKATGPAGEAGYNQEARGRLDQIIRNSGADQPQNSDAQPNPPGESDENRHPR